MELIDIYENGIYLNIGVAENGEVNLLNFSSLPFACDAIATNVRNWFKLVEIQVNGENQDDHHGSKHTGTSPGSKLRYIGHNDFRNDFGRKLEIKSGTDKITVTSHFQFFDNIAVIRSWTEICNISNETTGIEYISSFCLTGIEKNGNGDWDKRCILHIPHNAWVGEVQWRSDTLGSLGLDQVSSLLSTKRLSYSNTGTWSSHELLPMGCFENPGSKESLLWQIETNGSWHWEISTIAGYLYLQLSGPTQNENHWFKNLGKNEKFTSVPVSLAAVNGGFEKANEEMIKYRRSIRRANMDNEALPVIFNDYMNCLFADPTTEKLIPLIDSAAEAGCEYYCIDAGWYADGLWWDEVGEWLPSEKRFPGGIKEPLDYIRSKGMIPGLWLEIEVVGIHCAVAHEMPDDWFFMRHGKRIIDHSRYQLDFRNKDVVSHASSIIDRLVCGFGAGYIKMDYNINAGIGTDLNADSPGDGLLEHNRAYLKWIDSIFEKYPDLIIENCASGGMRMDYAMLSRLSIQSVTDQTDYRKNAVIAAAAPSAATPEQCAIWSYPLKDKDEEEVIFNMVNAMLMRIHQSGHLAELSPARFHLVKLGIACYKSIRGSIRTSTPFWPLGLPGFTSQWLCLGLKNDEKAYLAVWKLETEDSSICIPINCNLAHVESVKCIYPDYECCEYMWLDDVGKLEIKIQGKYIARLFELTLEKAKGDKP